MKDVASVFCASRARHLGLFMEADDEPFTDVRRLDPNYLVFNRFWKIYLSEYIQTGLNFVKDYFPYNATLLACFSIFHFQFQIQFPVLHADAREILVLTIY